LNLPCKLPHGHPSFLKIAIQLALVFVNFAAKQIISYKVTGYLVHACMTCIYDCISVCMCGGGHHVVLPGVHDLQRSLVGVLPVLSLA
jgi:hypothetical protein